MWSLNQMLARIARPLCNLPPDDYTPPTPDPNARRRPPVVCEYCECKLAPDGSVMSMSDKAREFREASEKIKALKADLEAEQTEHRKTRDELTAARAAVPQERRMFGR